MLVLTVMVHMLMCAPMGGSAPQLRIAPQAPEERIVHGRGRKLFFGGNAGIDHDQAFRVRWW